MDNLLYFAADTLGTTLYHLDSGVVKGHEARTMPLGPWKVPLDLDVTSDFITPTVTSFWMTLGASLRCYAIIKSHTSWIIVLDTDLLKGVGADTLFAATTLHRRIHEIAPAIKGVFKWSLDKWESVAYDETLGA